MFNRLRCVLVESYIGAIALGYLLAQCIVHFAATFVAPLTDWVSESEAHHLAPGMLVGKPEFSLHGAGAQFATFIAQLLIWYLLLRWLYLSGKIDDSRARTEQTEPR